MNELGSCADYLLPLSGGRVFASIDAARAASLQAGDEVLVRDLGQIVPPQTWSGVETRGKWQLRPYRLADGERGRLLMVSDVAKKGAAEAVPPEFVVELNLPGWYAVWVGIPRIDLRPVTGAFTEGVDVALDSDPAFVQICAERGNRHGRIMGPMDVEISCFWKCARLVGRKLRVRVPWGTFVSFPWGLVRGCVSSLRLIKLSDEQAAAYLADVSSAETRRVIVADDGFSHYCMAGEPGKGVDARFVQQYRDSDVRMLFCQTPSTGVANWPSKVADVLGEGMTDELWAKRRLGDKRAYDYVRWAIEHGEEGYAVRSRLCREAGIECHASLRMNLFFRNDSVLGDALEEMFNGRFWRDHPELRIPGDKKLDYAHPEARQFVVDILTELATMYDIDGVNLDFTRWPPVADHRRHGPDVLTGFVLEIRRALDEVARERKRELALSASIVEGYHATLDCETGSLEEQKIDLETWCASGALDFVCVEAWDHAAHLAGARKHGVPFYAIQDQESIDVPGGFRHDLDWQQDGRQNEDPIPDEALEEQPPVNSRLDPTEYDRVALKYYRLGVDGICLHNTGGDHVRRLGHVEELAGRVETGEIWGQVVGPRLILG